MHLFYIILVSNRCIDFSIQNMYLFILNHFRRLITFVLFFDYLEMIFIIFSLFTSVNVFYI